MYLVGAPGARVVLWSRRVSFTQWIRAMVRMFHHWADISIPVEIKVHASTTGDIVSLEMPKLHTGLPTRVVRAIHRLTAETKEKKPLKYIPMDRMG